MPLKRWSYTTLKRYYPTMDDLMVHGFASSRNSHLSTQRRSYTILEEQGTGKNRILLAPQTFRQHHVFQRHSNSWSFRATDSRHCRSIPMSRLEQSLCASRSAHDQDKELQERASKQCPGQSTETVWQWERIDMHEIINQIKCLPTNSAWNQFLSHNLWPHLLGQQSTG